MGSLANCGAAFFVLAIAFVKWINKVLQFIYFRYWKQGFNVETGHALPCLYNYSEKYELNWPGGFEVWVFTGCTFVSGNASFRR